MCDQSYNFFKKTSDSVTPPTLIYLIQTYLGDIGALESQIIKVYCAFTVLLDWILHILEEQFEKLKAGVEYVQKRDKTLIFYQMTVTFTWLLGLTTIIPATV